MTDLLERHRRTLAGDIEAWLCTDEDHAHVCGRSFYSLLDNREGERPAGAGWVDDFAAYDGVTAALTSSSGFPLFVRNGGGWQRGEVESTDQFAALLRTQEGLAVVAFEVHGALVARRVTTPSVEISLPLARAPEGWIRQVYRLQQRTLVEVSANDRSFVFSIESLGAAPRAVLECDGHALLRHDTGTAECITNAESRDHVGSWTVEVRKNGLFTIDTDGHEAPIALPPAAFTYRGIERTWSAWQLARGGGRLFALASARWVSTPLVRTDFAVFELTSVSGACPSSTPRCLGCDLHHHGDPIYPPPGSADVEELP